MSNGKGKGKGKKTTQQGNLAGDGQFHYFSLELIKNPDGTVTIKWGMLNEFPDGWILKDFSVNKHTDAWDEQTAQSATDTWLGSPYGLGPSQSEDIRYWPQWVWEFTDQSTNAPGTGVKYNITGSAGFANDVSSGNPVGSEVLTVTF